VVDIHEFVVVEVGRAIRDVVLGDIAVYLLVSNGGSVRSEPLSSGGALLGLVVSVTCGELGLRAFGGRSGAGGVGEPA
jgi:hypothetical protein